MNKKILLALLSIVCIFLVACDTKNSPALKKYFWLLFLQQPSNAVNIVKHDNGVRVYYAVTLDYTQGKTPRQIGQLYGQAIKAQIPDYETILRGYLHDILQETKKVEPWTVTYTMIKNRVDAIMPQLDQAYRDEIEGMAENFSNTGYDGDDILDRTYLAYTISLLPDVVRPFACNAFGVDGSHSTTGKSILYRTLEWDGGTSNQLNKMHAVVKFVNGTRTFYSIGYLGIFSVISGINRSKIYAAILDASTLIHYGSPANQRSYLYDLRYCLETMTSVDTIANYMSNVDGHIPPTENGGISPYAYNHLIFMGDATKALVVENFVANDNNAGFPKNQAIRASADHTKLSLVITNWDYWYHTTGSNGYLPAVNGFLKDVDLTPNNYFDNMWPLYSFNFVRILAIKNRFVAKGGPGVLTLGVEDVKDIIIQSNTTKNPDTGDMGDCTRPGDYMFGDVYNSDTQQVMIFQPDLGTDGPGIMKFQIFFAPYMAPLPSCANLKTSFEEITLTLP